VPEGRLAEVFDVSSFFNVELACMRPHRFLQLAATFASLFIRRARAPLFVLQVFLTLSLPAGGRTVFYNLQPRSLRFSSVVQGRRCLFFKLF